MQGSQKGRWEDNLSTALKTVDDSIQNLRKQFSTFQEKQSYGSSKSFFPTSTQSPERLNSSLFPQYESTPMQKTRPSFQFQASPHVSTFYDSGPSPALATSLSRRVEEQSETISSLSSIVAILQEKNKSQAELISQLKDDVSKLSSKSKNGTTHDLDSKLNKFRKEMQTEIAKLREDFGNKHFNDDPKSVGKKPLSTLSKSVIDNRKLCQDEFTSLKTEMDNLKTRIVKYELDLSSTSGEYKDLNRRHDKLAREVSHLDNRHHDLANRLDRMEDKQSRQSLDPYTNGLDNFSETPSEKKTRSRKDKKVLKGAKSRDRKSTKQGKTTKLTLTDSESTLSLSQLENSLVDDSFADLNTEDLLRGNYSPRDTFQSSSQSSIESDLLQSL